MSHTWDVCIAAWLPLRMRVLFSVLLCGCSAALAVQNIPTFTQPAGIHNVALDAPNVLQLQVKKAALTRARDIFDAAVRPHLKAGLIQRLASRKIPCEQLRSPHGNFFVMRAGSSTDETKADSSDLAWVSVDDMETWCDFRDIFDDMGIVDAVAPLVDTDAAVRLYSSFFVIRSRCAAPNLHADWPDATGVNAFTLLTPLEEYTTDDFQLLYEDSVGLASRRTTGEANLDGLRRYRRDATV